MRSLRNPQFFSSLPDFDTNDVIDVNLIGHSRGAGVVSLAMNQLTGNPQDRPADGYYELTLLDPHPASNSTLGDISTRSATARRSATTCFPLRPTTRR